MVSNCAKWLEVVCATLIKSAERRAPSAERRAPMPSAERAREQADPPSPPDRRPPRRGGRPFLKDRIRRRPAGGFPQRPIPPPAGCAALSAQDGAPSSPPPGSRQSCWRPASPSRRPRRPRPDPNAGEHDQILQGYSSPGVVLLGPYLYPTVSITPSTFVQPTRPAPATFASKLNKRSRRRPSAMA